LCPDNPDLNTLHACVTKQNLNRQPCHPEICLRPQVFDPTDLSEELTPAACRAALAGGAYARAALLALRLRDPALLASVAWATPLAQARF
jgi:hypothetical protein